MRVCIATRKVRRDDRSGDVPNMIVSAGALRQIGEAGVAMVSLVGLLPFHRRSPAIFCQAIAVHTFVVLWTRRQPEGLRAPIVVVVAILLFLVLFVGISIGLHPSGSTAFEKPDPVSLPQLFIYFLCKADGHPQVLVLDLVLLRRITRSGAVP